jgi:hypothetical protein
LRFVHSSPIKIMAEPSSELDLFMRQERRQQQTTRRSLQVARDDASMLERTHKIDALRERVELQLQSLLGNDQKSELTKIRQQVQDLRGSTRNVNSNDEGGHNNISPRGREISKRSSRKKDEIVWNKPPSKAEVPEVGQFGSTHVPHSDQYGRSFRQKKKKSNTGSSSSARSPRAVREEREDDVKVSNREFASSSMASASRRTASSSLSSQVILEEERADDDDEEEADDETPFPSVAASATVSQVLMMEDSNMAVTSSPPSLPKSGVAKDKFPTSNGSEETTYVSLQQITDPYGDAGIYSGNVIRVPSDDGSGTVLQPHGLGTMDYRDGRKYSGGWCRGQWSGHGVALFANGDKFQGHYDMDRRHGYGRYEWKDGRVYEGEFREGEYLRCIECAAATRVFAHHVEILIIVLVLTFRSTTRYW